MKKKSSIKYTPKVKFELKELINDLSISLDDIDTSHISDMSSLFQSTKRTDFSGIENWDVSNVTNMSGMFEGVKSFNQPLNAWDVSRVKNMSYMFPYMNLIKISITGMSQMLLI